MDQVEHDLIKRAQGGDIGAFKLLVEENQKQVFNMAMELTGNWADADDLQGQFQIRVMALSNHG